MLHVITHFRNRGGFKIASHDTPIIVPGRRSGHRPREMAKRRLPPDFYGSYSGRDSQFLPIMLYSTSQSAIKPSKNGAAEGTLLPLDLKTLASPTVTLPLWVSKFSLYTSPPNTLYSTRTHETSLSGSSLCPGCQLPVSSWADSLEIEDVRKSPQRNPGLQAHPE